MADIDELVAAAHQAQRDGRWHHAAAVWRDVIWRAADHEDRGSFCANYGRALLESGEKVRAVQLLSRVAQLYPGRADCCSSLALAYSRNDAHDRAAPVWADVLARFPGDRDRRWWLPSAAHSWLEINELDRAEEACREAIADFPDSAWGFAMFSVVEERRFHWQQALEMVESALGVCTVQERHGLIVSKLRILGEMGQVNACLSLIDEELARSPDSAALQVAAAYLAAIQGPRAAAEQRWESAVATCPDAPEAHIGKAWLERVTGRAVEAEALLQECCARWPDLFSLHRALADARTYLRDMEGARQAWAEAARIAPLSIFRLWGQCAFLGSCGGRDEAEALLAERAAAGSVLWRGRFEYAKAARELDAALACLAELRALSPDEGAFALAEAEIRSWRQAEGDLEEAARILQSQLDASPQSVRSADLLVRVLVLLGRADEAAATLLRIPAEDTRQSLCEARVWNDARTADWTAVSTRWDDLQSRFFQPALHLPKADLHLLGGKLKRGAEKSVLVASMVRNEMPRLPGFLEHYRKLGVSGFVLIDNGSQDGTVDFLASQPDIVLYSTSESFAQSCFGMRWLNQVIDRHGQGWVLFADADERLVFPGSARRSVQDLTRHLTARGEQIVPAVMIDMFPRHAGGDDGARHEWFDPLQIRPSVTCPFIEAAGGVRRRLFGTTVTLSKAPLVNAGEGIRYLSNHTTTPGRVSAIRAGLLHYHLNYLFDAANVDRLKEEVARGEHSDHAVDRRRSLAMMQALEGGDLTGPDSQRYTGPQQLLRLGLLAGSEDFGAKSA